MKALKVGCVVMAAGNARRFGANKLAAKLDGRSLIQRTLDAIPAKVFESVIIVTQYPEIAELAQGYPFTVIHNEHPDFGISHTIKLGLPELMDCDGVMFLVSDQPRLTQQSVAALTDFWRQQPDRIAALGHEGVRGNPCLFPARFFPELMALEGDHGGSTVIRRHPEALLLLETDAHQLADTDTPAQLEQLQQ